MGKLDGRVALITGAARGQGRSHAIRLAREGADIVLVDICRQIESVPYKLASRDDLSDTAEQVEASGRIALSFVADVRRQEDLGHAVDETYDRLGRLDIVIANAGIASIAAVDHPDAWRDNLDVNLTGTFNTLQVTVPRLVAAQNGGVIVITSSAMGFLAHATDAPGALGYIASKHGINGIRRAYANLLAPHGIRVNTLHPSGVRTGMSMDPDTGEMNKDLKEFYDNCPPQETRRNSMPIDILEPDNISDALLWLVSDEARYVTGQAISVDAGYLLN